MPGIMTWTGNTFGIGGFRITYGSMIMLVLFAALRLRAGEHGLGQARLRDR